MKVFNQLKLIHSTKWDFLIVLDACRADFFQKLNWIKGKYRVVLSPANYTLGWLQRTFPGYYPFTVYSSSPFINSKGVVKEYDARRHFKEIVDIWDFGWDDDLSTVPPWRVYEVARDAGPRSIIWFMQPHLPGVGAKKLVPKMIIPGWRRPSFIEGKPGDIAVIEELKKGKITGDEVRQAYLENLRLVLGYVERLLGELEGRCVVTSDHGEFLGEDGMWLHPNVNHTILRTVPWLEVEV